MNFKNRRNFFHETQHDREEKIKVASEREQKKVTKNIFMSILVAWFFLCLLFVRYAWLQIHEGDKLTSRIRLQTGEEFVRQSPRGTIYDCNGKELAVSLVMKSLFIDPDTLQKSGKNQNQLVKELSKIISVPEEEIFEDIAKGGGFVWVKHFLSTDEVHAVRKLIRDEEYNCLGFNDELKRSYPNGFLAANILGFVGKDDIGLDGIEQEFDTQLKGSRVTEFLKTDIQSRPILDSIFAGKPYTGEKCKSIYLTIDSTVQFMVEQALDEVFKEKKAENAVAIVMNPKTGEILAMASRPSYDPNYFYKYPMEDWQNQAVSVIYEPGSTFKSVVAAAALQEGIVQPHQWFNDIGYFKVADRTIRNSELDSYGWITFADIVKKSVNTGFAQVGMQLGAKKLNKYAKLFGFGNVTGIELPGEGTGILFEEEKMVDPDVATMAIGQSIAVTPIQLITAMAAIANDGVLMRPHIVKKIENVDGTLYEETKPLAVRRAITSGTAKAVVELLEGVVTDGGGRKAQVKGYRIAGKTGTAQKPRRDGVGGYIDGHYIASFCGFAPVENPQFVVLVIVDDPEGLYYGSYVAAPVVSKIFSQLFLHYQIQASSEVVQRLHEEESRQRKESGANGERIIRAKIVVPEFLGQDFVQAKETAEKAGLILRETNDSYLKGKAVFQSLEPNSVVSRGSEIVVRFASKK